MCHLSVLKCNVRRFTTVRRAILPQAKTPPLGGAVSPHSMALVVCTSGEWILQTHTLIGQQVQLPSYDWTRATQLYLFSNQNVSL